jgi:hypothetical protein
MAKFGAFINAGLSINGTNLSARVESVTLDLSKDDLDITAMGDGGHQHVGTLENSKLTVSFWQDFASSQVDAILLPVFQGGTAVPFKLVSSGSVASATNPMYSGNVVLIDYAPIGGKVGDALMAPTQFVVSGSVTSATAGTV